MRARPVSVDVREFAWTSTIGIALPNENTELILWVKTNVPETAVLDEVYCARVLMNLLRYVRRGLAYNSNAIKFTTSGYIVVTVSSEDDTIVFSVRDTGIGISNNLSQAIFEPFVQADTSLTRRHQGYNSIVDLLMVDPD